MQLQKATIMLTEPFVRVGLYSTSAQALKHIILDYLDRQIAQAKAECQQYEAEYQTTFEAWSATLTDRATMDEEDTWMEWEATRDMLEGWLQIKHQIEESYV